MPNNTTPKIGDIRIRRLDERNIIVERYRKFLPKAGTDDEGREGWDLDGYFSTLQGAAMSALNNSAKGDSTKELAQSVKDATDKIVAAVRDYTDSYDKRPAPPRTKKEVAA